MKNLFHILVVGIMFVATANAFAGNPDTEAPSAPGNLRGWVYDPDFIYINWAPAADNVGVYVYRVYRDDELIATTYDKHFLDMEYDRDFLHVYWVTAVDRAGNESPISNMIRDPRMTD